MDGRHAIWDQSAASAQSANGTEFIHGLIARFSEVGTNFRDLAGTARKMIEALS